ncbi:MAG: PSP1 domain-containing protein [Bradymonadaceae bacterium]
MSSTTTNTEPKLNKRRPFGGKKKLFNIVPIQYRTNYVKHDADARELQLRAGDEVVVETTRGPIIATVTGPVYRKVLPIESIPRVLRKANDSDTNQAQKNESLETEAYRFGIERIRARKLPMKMIRAQYLHDGSKIVFYFSADGRIDFRDLVKDLAHRFRTRIEMHQIGVRDGARMLGGIGPCGRELCCSTFLDNFEPVSIRMAKDQGLTLNPKKVSGMCGRLMCCLVYEQAIYRSMRTRLPRSGQAVSTEFGRAKIIDVDIINRRATVLLADNNRRLLPVEEIEVIDPNKVSETVDDDTVDAGEYLWDDVKTPRRRPSRSKDSKKSSDSSGSKDSRGSKDKKDSKGGRDRSRRQRSRRRSRGGGNKTDGKAVEATAADAAVKTDAKTKSAPKSEAKTSSKSGKPKSKSSRNRRRSRRRSSSKKGSNQSGNKSTQNKSNQDNKSKDSGEKK